MYAVQLTPPTTGAACAEEQRACSARRSGTTGGCPRRGPSRARARGCSARRRPRAYADRDASAGAASSARPHADDERRVRRLDPERDTPASTPAIDAVPGVVVLDRAQREVRRDDADRPSTGSRTCAVRPSDCGSSELGVALVVAGVRVLDPDERDDDPQERRTQYPKSRPPMRPPMPYVARSAIGMRTSTFRRTIERERARRGSGRRASANGSSTTDHA